jgi:hypothetical protein
LQVTIRELTAEIKLLDLGQNLGELKRETCCNMPREVLMFFRPFSGTGGGEMARYIRNAAAIFPDYLCTMQAPDGPTAGGWRRVGLCANVGEISHALSQYKEIVTV